MTQTHWKKLINPDYLGAYALEPGQDLVVTIDYIKQEQVIGTDGKKEELPVAHFVERETKPMILNSTNMKSISALFKTPYIEEWHGRQIQLYSEEVRAFGEVVDALRVRPFAPKQDKPKCADCSAEIGTVGKMSAKGVAEYTAKQYGRPLCETCAKAAKAKQDELKGADVLAANETV